MIKPRKRLSSALLSSIGIHALIFLVLFMSFSKTEIKKDLNTPSNERIAHEAIDAQFQKKVTTTALIESSANNVIAGNTIIEDEQRLLSKTEQRNNSKALNNKEEKETLKESILKMDTNSVDMVVSQSNLGQTSQGRNYLGYDEKALSIATKNDAGLLNIDTPNEIKQNKIDESEKSLKTQVEEVNTQLSAAINEVKERNQQKINQQRQQQNYSYISED